MSRPVGSGLRPVPEGFRQAWRRRLTDAELSREFFTDRRIVARWRNELGLARNEYRRPRKKLPPHGTVARYVAGCRRCKKGCRRANTLYVAARRAKQKQA